MRALKFKVNYYHRDQVAPGYWFVAPYGVIHPETPTQRWHPCQVGPYIYDQDGMLIWAGSCMFNNRNIFDFRAANNIDDNYHLSFILQHAFEGPDKGHGYVLDEKYEEEYAVPVTNNLGAFNMHEFRVLDGGKTALATAYRPKEVNLGDLGRPHARGWIMTGGFVEMDMATGEVLFEWMSPGHIPISESVKVGPDSPPAARPGWDYVHVNAIDKDEAGNYLLSARFTNAIYYISGQTGEIIWRLGGKNSDFHLDFKFSRQHHSSFVASNETHVTVSFLNNASDEGSNQEDTSSVLYVQVDMSASPMTAKLVHRYMRPDGGLTRLRGSVQTLPNGNVFAGWSERGYHSEHTPDGKVLMEAKFASGRFNSYRSYKFPFRGRPSTPPDVVASVYGTGSDAMTTVIHVSWNGATDIASWNFYAKSHAGGSPVLVGSTNKTDFETMYIANGYLDWVTAEALDADGKSLGESKPSRSNVPDNWKAVGFKEAEEPTPDDPKALYDSKDEMGGMDGMNGMDQEAEHSHSKQGEAKAHEVLRMIGGLVVFILVISSIGGAVVGIFRALRRRRMRSYTEIPFDEDEDVPVMESRRER